MKKLLVILMALAFSVGCASFVAAADTATGDQPAQTTTKKTRTPVEGRGILKQTQLVYSRGPARTLQRLPSLRRTGKMIYASPSPS